MKISNEDLAILVMILIFLSMANIFPIRSPTRGHAATSANITLTVINPPPEILSYYPNTTANITEEQNQTFNVSFTDNEPELGIEWTLNKSIVKQEVKDVPGASEYVFVANYSSAGLYNVTVTISDIEQSVQLIWELNVSNVNRVPYFKTIPDISWYEGSTHTMESLDNYAVDPDVEIDDKLSYEIIFISEPSKIRARIDPITHEVWFRAIPNFVGSEIVYFKVTDSWGAFNYSNNVTLTVKPIPEKREISGGGGGGGGGGGRIYEDLCDNYWYCGKWGPCDPINNTRTRVCIDLAGCDIARNKPKEIENCTYTPTCYDKIKNGGEIGIDCGGPCPSCWTCDDGIKNQGEEGIDCGGPCMPCPTCDDGKRNCQRLDKETVLCENGVDCGGPCPMDCCENQYFDANLGEEDIDCGGNCKPCELMAPKSFIKRILGSPIFAMLLVIVAVVILVTASSIVVMRYKKKKVQRGIEEGIALRDLRRMYEGINRLEKNIDSTPNRKIIRLLSYITIKIIHYRFKVDLSCTEKELLERLAKIRKEGLIRDILMRIYSRLYYLKYSGEEVSKDELMLFIKELKVISYITLRRFYFEQKYKSKLKDKNRFLAKIFSHIKKGKPDKEVMRKLKEEYKEKKVKPEEIKKKVIPVVFVVLTVAMMFSLFIIPQSQISKSGYSVTKDTTKADIRAGFGVEREGLTEGISIVKERSLLGEFVNWLIRVIRTVGRAPGEFPPEFIYPIESQVFNAPEDSNFSLLVQGYDNDGNGDYPLTFSFLAEETETKFIFQRIPKIIPNYNDTAGWINFTPTEEYVYDSNKVKSDYTVTIVVKDSTEMSDSIWVILNVTNVNDPPKIIEYSPANLTPSVDENKSITFWFNNNTADPDLIHPGYDYITNEWYFNGVYNNSDESWTYYPGFCDANTYNVTLVVTDSYGLSDNLTWELNVNDIVKPPTINKSFDDYDYVEWVEGNDVLNNITLKQFFEDTEAIECSKQINMSFGYETVPGSVKSVDGTELNIEIDPNTSNVSFKPPNDNWFGVQVIRYYADNGARTYSPDIVLNVTNMNDPPVLDEIPDQYLMLDAPYVYDVNASDADNDVLYFSSNTTLFNISQDTGIINFTPTVEATYSINITVNDSEFIDSQIVTFIVGINFPPVINPIPNQNATEGKEFRLNVTAFDPNIFQNLTFIVNNSMINIIYINISAVMLYFIPTYENIGNYSIMVNVTDPGNLSDYTIFNLTVYGRNRAPNITRVYPYGTPLSNTTVFEFNYRDLFPENITSINVTENSTLLFNQTSYDKEGDPLRCVWYLDGILKENNSCADIPYWNYEIDFYQSGIRNVTIVVDDLNDNTDRFTWNVSVLNVNQNPTFGEKILTSYLDFAGGTTYQTNITIELGKIILGKINSIAYYREGTYMSPVIDLQAHYDRTKITKISWKESRPSGTNITFRARTSNTIIDMLFANWSDTYYNGSENNIIDSTGRYIQFSLNMTTDNDLVTPKVEEVTINYEIRSTEITGNYVSWIDLDNYFDDKDGITTLNYKYEDISSAFILGLSIDSESNIVSLYPITSGIAVFRFVVNDSYSAAYSNNITLDVKLETPTVIIVSTTSGGGGGSSERKKIKIVPVPEVAYQQLIYVEPLKVTNRTITAPIILKNTADSLLSDIYLGAKTDMGGISFKFERDYFSSLDVNQEARTNLYITSSHFINKSYSVDVIANVTEPRLQDISVININPLENITEKINLVMDLLQLHPVCRELEEVVVKAHEALNNNRYEEADALLTEVIDSCKYLVTSLEEKPVPKEPLVVRKKWIFIISAILVVILLLAYFVPRVINRMRRPRLYEKI